MNTPEESAAWLIGLANDLNTRVDMVVGAGYMFAEPGDTVEEVLFQWDFFITTQRLS